MSLLALEFRGTRERLAGCSSFRGRGNVFPKLALRENFQISLSSSRCFVCFWEFSFSTQVLHSIKNSKSLWRAIRQPLGEYTREEMKQKK